MESAPSASKEDWTGESSASLMDYMLTELAIRTEATSNASTSRRWKNTNVRRTNGKNIRNKMKENKCGQCHYFRAKDGACRNRKMRNECFPDDKDGILYVSRDERQCALFKPQKSKYEPKTCITCKHRRPKIHRLFDGSEEFRYVCYERGKTIDVSGRHHKCDKFEQKTKNINKP